MNHSSLFQHYRTWRFDLAIPSKLRLTHQPIEVPATEHKHTQSDNVASEQRRYIPALDGLRALSVLAVVAYHLNFDFASGGSLGVDVFFVLSGFLITDILFQEWRSEGKIDLKRFWLHRIRRLLPALFTMLLVVVGYMAIAHPNYIGKFYGDILAATFYMSNWWLIFHHVSYFSQFGAHSPFLHLWSLAVEEQFYLVWPLLLLLGLRTIRNQKWLLFSIILAASASAITMAFLYQPFTDPSRVYYGTDTRAFSLLIGVALALLMASHNHLNGHTKKIPWHMDAIGLISLFILVAMMIFSNEYQSGLYQGGMVFLSLVSAALIAVLAHPGSRLGAIFSLLPLRWIGQRSYGIYLWHYPIIALTTPVINTGESNPLLIFFQVAASLFVADLSWRFIETPIRYGELPFSTHYHKTKNRDHHVQTTNSLKRNWVLVSCAAIIILSIGIADLHKILLNSTASAKIVRSRHEQQKTSSSQKPKPPLHHKTQTKIQVHNMIPVVGKEVTAIGDSIMIDTKPYLQRNLPGIWVDGMVGRQMYQLGTTLAQLRTNGNLHSHLIIELGTNGPFNETSIATLLRGLHEREIIVVNTRVPRLWQDTVNDSLAQLVAQVPHAILINWYKASTNHNDYFYPDGVHLDPQGASVLARLMTIPLKTQASIVHRTKRHSIT